MSNTTRSCVYIEGHSNGHEKTWHTECGRKVYMEAPEDVGMPSYPLPTTGGRDYCPYCGGRVHITERKR